MLPGSRRALALADSSLPSSFSSFMQKKRSENQQRLQLVWFLIPSARCLFPGPVTKAAGFGPEGSKRHLFFCPRPSLIASVRRNTLWCVQTSPKWGPALEERAASCSTGSEPSGAPPAPPLRQPNGPGAASPPAGPGARRASRLFKATIDSLSDLCLCFNSRRFCSLPSRQDPQAAAGTPARGPLELPSYISLCSSPEEADAADTPPEDASRGKGRDTDPAVPQDGQVLSRSRTLLSSLGEVSSSFLGYIYILLRGNTQDL